MEPLCSTEVHSDNDVMNLDAALCQLPFDRFESVHAPYMSPGWSCDGELWDVFR